jgi:cytochrome c
MHCLPARQPSHRLKVALSIALASAIGAMAPASHAMGEHYDAPMNYRLHCEGCHKEDGSGQPGYIPALRGNVARFLSTEEGRMYLARVPGTAQSLLTDSERADVLNYIVRSFDADHLPAGFEPYRPEELARWRYDALSQPSVVRARLIAQMEPARPASASGGAARPMSVSAPAAAPAPAPAAVPEAFAVCAVCHTVTPDGAPGIGPNLHGVVGRKAGTGPSFSYSPAMRDAGFQWTRQSLDEYLTSPAAKVPGNYMMFNGEPDPEQRKLIIDYLESIR